MAFIANVVSLPSDYELIGTTTFQGTTLRCWRNGQVVTLAWDGYYTSKASAGAKNVYITVPAAYRPITHVWSIVQDQSGHKAILDAQTSGNVGLYYLLDASAKNTNVYGFLTWVAGS